MVRLATLARENKLPDKDIIAIDLRMAGRITVRLSEDAATQRMEAKTKKTKPKGGRHEFAQQLHAPQKPLPARKSAVLCVLDVGTSKVACLIAKLLPAEQSDLLRGRTHRCRILGIGHQRSRGLKGGAVVDMEEAEDAIRHAVDAAERMAGVQVESVIVNVSGGRLGLAAFQRAYQHRRTRGRRI